MAYSLFERRRRTAARIALYGSFATVIALTLATYSLLNRVKDLGAEVKWSEVAWGHVPAVRLFQQYLRIDSTTLVGDEYGAALLLAAPLEAAGIDVTIERLGDRQANLWAVLEGENPEAVVLHSHLDTEPILDLAAWELEPFSATLSPPWIYGRGAFDMKSFTVAQLLAVLELAHRHPRPKRSVVLLATSSEERGSDLGTRWILDQHPELVERFWAVITEGGVVEVINLAEPVKYWGTEFAQKRFITIRACSASRERLELLHRDVVRTGLPSTGLSVPEEVRRFWLQYAPTRDAAWLRDALADPELYLRDPVALGQLPYFLRSQLRNELVAFEVEASPDGGFELRLVAHLLPEADADEALGGLLPEWMTHGVSLIRREVATATSGSSLEHPVFAAIEAELAASYPRQPAGPVFLAWTATDARFYRLAGIPTYGFSPFFLLTPDTLNIGLANEKIALPGFASGVDLMARLLERIAMEAE